MTTEAKAKPKHAKQCKTCPWRVDVKPSRDVPDYDPGIYERIKNSLREGLASMTEETRLVMECHNGKRGENRPCAGWLHHQLGVGNNLSVRIAVITGRLPPPKVFGKQHKSFEGLDE